ncbi:MAG TPA: GTP-binding protein, partial [Chromatiaceae bacterium]|nr:GTP-binding protein [Chromatiaceae bacterium]
MTDNIRNIAIIAHVDHGKTTLVDALLQQSNTLDSRKDVGERLMDSNDLEKERGITILSKNTAINWGGFRINMVDTPGHADFGGEVERVLSMVDSVLLLVDAVEGPMPQTRFVTQKAFAQGLSPIVVINKIDRDGARIDAVIDETFDLFDRLGATDEQLDFPIIYASGLDGYATLDLDQPSDNMDPLFQTIIDKTPPPDVDVDGPFQLQVSSLEYNSYVGAIGVGRITRGHIKSNSPVVVVDTEGATRRARILQIFTFLGLEKIESDYAEAGDIIAFTGIEAPRISDTVCDPAYAEALPALSVDEPTVSMAFQVNTSPFTGNDGKFVTSRQLRDRLQRELIHNVALRVEDTATPD